MLNLVIQLAEKYLKLLNILDLIIEDMYENILCDARHSKLKNNTSMHIGLHEQRVVQTFFFE